MATYVFSDVHGHAATLDRALCRVSPSGEDTIFCLGDMIDRGPDPVGVLTCVRGLAGAHALMGNHEELMLDCLDEGPNGIASINWGMNGGDTTSRGMEALDQGCALELVDWVRGLPRWAVTQVGGRLFLLSHAGVNLDVETPCAWDLATAEAYLSAQSPEDLLWVREEFWCDPRGLSGADGTGPFVVCGHTPTPYLERLGCELDRPAIDAKGRARMVRAGAARDRWDVDCACAGGAGLGQVLILRLDDGAEFYEPVLDGE